MDWTTWLKSLAAVAIGGAATGAASAMGSGQINRNAAVTAGIGALATVLAYLMQSPLGPATPQIALPVSVTPPLTQASATPPQGNAAAPAGGSASVVAPR
ncbi:MAG: hypothetical protein ABSC23_10530 [Bryobacteraceae bacterium]|jgi:hypothetical protein